MLLFYRPVSTNDRLLKIRVYGECTGPFPCCVCTHRLVQTSPVPRLFVVCITSCILHTIDPVLLCKRDVDRVPEVVCHFRDYHITHCQPLITSPKNSVRWESKLVSPFQPPPRRLEVTVTRLFISSTRLHGDIKWDISVLFMIRESYWDSEITICW